MQTYFRYFLVIMKLFRDVLEGVIYECGKCEKDFIMEISVKMYIYNLSKK